MLKLTFLMPKLVIIKKVPPHAHPNVKRAMDAMFKSEAKRVHQSTVPLKDWFELGDEVRVLNPNQFKLHHKKIGHTMIVVVHHKNN